MGEQQNIEAQVAQYELNQTLNTIKSNDQKTRDGIKAKIKSFNLELKGIEADRQSTLKAKADPDNEKAILELQAVRTAIQYGTPGHPNYTSFEYNQVLKDIAVQQKYIDGYNARLTTIDNNYKATQKKINDLQHPPKLFFPYAGTGVSKTSASGKNKGDTTTSIHQSTPDTNSIKFNIPMVSQAYFRGIQAEVLNGNHVDAGRYVAAQNTWSIGADGTPISGRGAFQIDRKTTNAAAVAQAVKDAATLKTKPDTNLYGFRFLYNPNSVNMNWGSVQAQDPIYESSGQDVFIPGTSNLIQSYVDFSIIINRIEDFNYIDNHGLKKLMSVPSNNPTDYGSKIVTVNNPYPKGISNSELVQIYEKGTMYDIEYLFKTMHALTGNVSYSSSLMGTTSDPGWLPVRPVELHLGNHLRYRVRIQSLSVNHTVFNPRMIPILSTVNFSCARYWDGPITTQAKKTTGKG